MKMERYDILKDLGSGNFGVAKLVKDKWTGELYAVKYIERGKKVRAFVALIFKILVLVLKTDVYTSISFSLI